MFDRACALEASEGPIQNLAGQAQITRDILQLGSRVRFDCLNIADQILRMIAIMPPFDAQP
jgi:hypothetical protein